MRWILTFVRFYVIDRMGELDERSCPLDEVGPNTGDTEGMRNGLNEGLRRLRKRRRMDLEFRVESEMEMYFDRMLMI